MRNAALSHDREAHARVLANNWSAEQELRRATASLNAARRRYEDRLRLDLG